MTTDIVAYAPAVLSLPGGLPVLITAAGLAADPQGSLFRTVNRERQLTERPMHRHDVIRMISAGAGPGGVCPRQELDHPHRQHPSASD